MSLALLSISYLYKNGLLQDFLKTKKHIIFSSEEDLALWYAQHFPDMIGDIENLTTRIAIFAMLANKNNKSVFRAGDNDTIMQAIDINPKIMEFITVQTEHMQMAALEKDISVFSLLSSNQITDAVKLFAVTKNQRLFRLVSNPDEATMIAAVSADVNNLGCINNPPKSVQFAAFRRSPTAIAFINGDIDPEIVRESVGLSGIAIRYVKEPTEELMLLAVEKAPSSIRFIKKPTELVQLTALEKNPSCFRYIRNPTDKVRVYAKLALAKF